MWKEGGMHVGGGKNKSEVKEQRNILSHLSDSETHPIC